MAPRRVRILRIISSLRVSGPALQAILLSAGFTDELHETWLLIGSTPATSDNMLDVARAYGVTPIVVPTLQRTLNPYKHWQTIRALMRIMQELRPDVVHTHLTTAGFWGRWVARATGVPVVVHTLHEHPFNGYYKRSYTTLFTLLERLTARITDSIITLSERLRRELVEERSITRKSAITVLPLGFDLTRFAQMPRHSGVFRTAQAIPAEVPLVGIVGRLTAVKNHALFLQAAQQVVRVRPEVCFVVVGDGTLRGTLEQTAHDLDLDAAVRFVGWQTDMPTLYSDVDVLVISSLNEGTPVPIIEALAAGCAVVATDVGGVIDLLDNGTLGALVPSGDANALAQAILNTISNPPDAARGRALMLSRYSLERLVHDLDSLYRGLLARNRRGSPS